MNTDFCLDTICPGTLYSYVVFYLYCRYVRQCRKLPSVKKPNNPNKKTKPKELPQAPRKAPKNQNTSSLLQLRITVFWKPHLSVVSSHTLLAVSSATATPHRSTLLSLHCMSNAVLLLPRVLKA